MTTTYVMVKGNGEVIELGSFDSFKDAYGKAIDFNLDNEVDTIIPRKFILGDLSMELSLGTRETLNTIFDKLEILSEVRNTGCARNFWELYDATADLMEDSLEEMGDTISDIYHAFLEVDSLSCYGNDNDNLIYALDICMDEIDNILTKDKGYCKYITAGKDMQHVSHLVSFPVVFIEELIRTYNNMELRYDRYEHEYELVIK